MALQTSPSWSNRPEECNPFSFLCTSTQDLAPVTHWSLSCLLSLVLSLSYTSWTQIPVTSRHARNISVSYLDPLLIINTWQHLSLDHSSVHYPPSANQVMYCVLCLFLNHLVLSSMKKKNSKLLHEEYVILSFKLVLVYRKFTLLEVLLLAS